MHRMLLTRQVVDTQSVNIVDAYKDPRFDPSVDDGTDFRHKTIMCMPIKNSEGHTIGVIQVLRAL